MAMRDAPDHQFLNPGRLVLAGRLVERRPWFPVGFHALSPGPGLREPIHPVDLEKAGLTAAPEGKTTIHPVDLEKAGLTAAPEGKTTLATKPGAILSRAGGETAAPGRPDPEAREARKAQRLTGQKAPAEKPGSTAKARPSVAKAGQKGPSAASGSAPGPQHRAPKRARDADTESRPARPPSKGARGIAASLQERQILSPSLAGPVDTTLSYSKPRAGQARG